MGDIKNIVPPEQRRLIVAPADTHAYQQALHTLITDDVLRHQLGVANAHQAARYSEAQMIATYSALYAAVIGQHV